MMEEKRKYMRFNLLLEALHLSGKKKEKVTVSDFSQNGIGIISERAIKKGEEVELELLIPGDNIPIVVTGEIAWGASDNISGRDKYRGGLKVKNIGASDKNKMLNYIYEKWLHTKNKNSGSEEKSERRKGN
ncbi:MAG: PilZ domain-containing protein [Candidatus Omnitrophica bacterium]|nr:PilZ domain-containing protein [Candidatus Omnitrophota bacterium]